MARDLPADLHGPADEEDDTISSPQRSPNLTEDEGPPAYRTRSRRVPLQTATTSRGASRELRGLANSPGWVAKFRALVAATAASVTVSGAEGFAGLAKASSTDPRSQSEAYSKDKG